MFRDFMKRSAAKELESAGAALNKTPSVGMMEQSAAAAGHVLGRAAGGAVIGAGVNGYEYSQTGMGFGGSFSMAESVLSGAVAGAIGGGLIGSLGAKAAGKRANIPRERAETRYAKAVSRAENRGLAGPVAPNNISQPSAGATKASKKTSTRTIARSGFKSKQTEAMRRNMPFKTGVATNAVNPVSTQAAPNLDMSRAIEYTPSQTKQWGVSPGATSYGTEPLLDMPTVNVPGKYDNMDNRIVPVLGFAPEYKGPMLSVRKLKQKRR